MKPIIVKILSPLILLLALSAEAQINTPAGYMHGTYHKGDTGTKYEYDADKVKHTDHADTVVIRRIPTQGSEARIKAIAHNRDHEGQAPKDSSKATASDTYASAAPVSPTPDSAIPQASSTGATTATGCDCINMNMIYTALAVFGLAAIIGMYLIVLVLRDKQRPLFVAFIHGLFATAGLTLFIVYCIHQPGPLASLTILIIAALCGLVLIYHDVTGRPVPKWLGALHGALALVGFVLLLIFAFAH